MTQTSVIASEAGVCCPAKRSNLTGNSSYKARVRLLTCTECDLLGKSYGVVGLCPPRNDGSVLYFRHSRIIEPVLQIHNKYSIKVIV
jgi:hypothetical protein